MEKIYKVAKNGSLYLPDAKSGIWYMRYRNAAGKIIRASTGKTDKALARNVLTFMENSVMQEKLSGKKEPVKITFAELTEMYLSKYCKQRDKDTVKQLLPFFGSYIIHDITPQLIENYLLIRAGKMPLPKNVKLKNPEKIGKEATVQKEYALGKRIFNVAMKKWRYCEYNPFAAVTFQELLPYNNTKDRILTVEEEAALYTACGDNILLQDIITFLLHTACRIGEIFTVDIKKHLSLSERMIFNLPAEKGGGIKTIPMSCNLYEMLSRRLQVPDISGRLFPAKYSAVKEAFEQVVKKAGLWKPSTKEQVSFHTLRHTCISRWCMSGVPDSLIFAMVGWQSPKEMIKRYAHYRSAKCKAMFDAAKALDSFYQDKISQAV